MKGGSSVVPVLWFAFLIDWIIYNTHHVALSLRAYAQNASGSKPVQTIELPPDRIGANRFRTMPPTWKRGIIFTKKGGKISSLLRMIITRTINIAWLQIPRMHHTPRAYYQRAKSISDDLLLAVRTGCMKDKGYII